MNPDNENPSEDVMPALEKSTELLAKFSDAEIDGISKLKEIFLETARINSEHQREVYELYIKFLKKHNAVYDKRLAALMDLRKNKLPAEYENSAEAGPLFQNFWLRVLKNTYTKYLINEGDEAILMHLIDIRSNLSQSPEYNFSLDFHFEPNEFFTDRVLRRTFYLTQLPYAEASWGCDMAIYRTQGCSINWTEARKKAKDEREDFGLSYFDFFRDDNRFESYTKLLGCYLHRVVIPKAILFYTGEHKDCNLPTIDDLIQTLDSAIESKSLKA